MKRVILLTAALLLAPTALADTALQRFDTSLRQAGIPIDGVSGSGPSCRIDFKPSATTQQRNDAQAMASAFDWLDTPDPAPKSFIVDCTADVNIPANSRLAINVMGLWYMRGEKQLALAIWTQLKASLTAGQVSAIQAHATDNNITLP
jgi:hypothetical protein